MQRSGFGVIGAGYMGERHIAELVKNHRTRLIALADINEARLQEISQKYGGEAYLDYAKLLERDDIDAVVIATSDEAHLEPSVAAARAGKHILLEKPIAATLEDAEVIISECQISKIKLLIGHIVRFDPRYIRVKEAIDRGDLGEIVGIWARRLNKRTAQERLKGRVSVLSFLGVHDFDIMRWLTSSEVERVYTEAHFGYNTSRGYDVEDVTWTLLRFASGVVGCAEIGWMLPEGHPQGADFKLEVTGTKGLAVIDRLHQSLGVATDERWIRPLYEHNVHEQMEHFIDIILEDKAPLISGEDGKKALEISLAAQESARSGKVINLSPGE